jgi:hypothetical protein
VTRAATNRRGVASALVCVAAASPALGAQSSQRADSLLAVGDVARAESVYYAAADAHPRDPASRWALGRFLVERGATRVGATLLEESLQFGGDPVLAGRELVRAYLELNEFAPLASLPAASPAQRERARWLATHEPRILSPDSVVTTRFLHDNDSSSLGGIPIRVNGVELVASVNSQTEGIVVSRAAMGERRPKVFAAGADSAGNSDLLAVADSVSIGALTMVNQPLTLSTLPAGTQALIGLSQLGRFAPTVNAKSGTLTLRLDGTVREQPPGDRLATLDHASGVLALRGRIWIASPAELARVLRDRVWTFDARRGTLIVER